MPVCPNCGNQAGEGAVFCDQCGARLPVPDVSVEQGSVPAAASVICPACGAGNVPGEAYCDFCGSPLEQPMPEAKAELIEAPETEVQPDSEEEVGAEASAPEEPLATAEPVGPAEGGPPTCPACGAEIQPDEAYCPDCGASLAQAPLPPEPAPEVEPEPVEEAATLVTLQPVVEPADRPDVEPEPTPETLIVEAEPQPATCPSCGIEVEIGDKFCRNCGAVLEIAPAAAEMPPAAASQGPLLIVVSSGAEIPLPAKDEILIGREDPVSGIYPDVDLTPHDGEAGGVSRRHAQLLVEGGKTFVEDLDSTNYTFVNRQRLVPRTRHPLKNGDELRCGRVALMFSE